MNLSSIVAFVVIMCLESREREFIHNFKANTRQEWRQRGRVVRAPDLKSLGFKSRSDHYLDLFSGVRNSTPLSCL